MYVVCMLSICAYLLVWYVCTVPVYVCVVCMHDVLCVCVWCVCTVCLFAWMYVC
jgi:hypothetical protein